MIRGLFRRASRAPGYPVAYEHPTQAIASAFLRAIADDDAAAIWERLSRETRGLLEGSRAARGGIALHEAAVTEGDPLRAAVAPLRAAALGALGGMARVGSLGVSAARLVDRGTAYVLLLADVEQEGILREEQWRPAHLLAFVHESREWLVDLGRTSALSIEAGLVDPLGPIR
jgi:hypothetical protein